MIKTCKATCPKCGEVKTKDFEYDLPDDYSREIFLGGIFCCGLVIWVDLMKGIDKV